MALSHAEHERLSKYTRLLADRMGLRDWTFIVSFDPPEDDEADTAPAAAIRCITGRKRATVYVADAWMTFDDDRKRHYLVHELVHPHFESAADIVRIDTAKTLGQTVYDVLWSGFLRQMEYGVDAMADVLAPLMPPYPGKEDGCERPRRRRKLPATSR
jgi:hypothetical protein